MNYINSRSAEFSNRENSLKAKLWKIEDKINNIQLKNYNVSGIGDYLKDFVNTFPELDPGERNLLIESLINRVEIGRNKRVILILTPPFKSFGFLSPQLAPRGIEPLFPS